VTAAIPGTPSLPPKPASRGRATCHNGVDHNEYENFMLSKHGTVYQTHQQNWNFEAPLRMP